MSKLFLEPFIMHLAEGLKNIRILPESPLLIMQHTLQLDVSIMSTSTFIKPQQTTPPHLPDIEASFLDMVVLCYIEHIDQP
jgi:hypothetical protein